MEVSAIEIFTLIYGGVLAWLALTNIQHMKKLAVIEKVLDGLVLKMDMFLKQEIDTLKDISRNIHHEK